MYHPNQNFNQTELMYAYYVQPILRNYLKMYTTYLKSIDKKSILHHAYINDMIGMIELRIALTQAIIEKGNSNA